MTNRAGWALAVAIVVLAGSVWLNAQAQGSTDSVAPSAAVAPSGNADHGKQLYLTVGCYECHGEIGQGVINTYDFASGPRLAAPLIAFRTFTLYTRGGGPRSPELMPPYTSKVLSDQDLADIYAFLKSVPPPPPLDSIRLLAPEQLISDSPKKP